MVEEENAAWHCLPTDVTEVMTPLGFLPLSMLKVGDEVYQWNKDTYEITVGNVEHVVEPRTEKVFRMKETEATLEHKVAYHTYNNPETREAKWGERLDTQTYFPDSAHFDSNGIGLSDAELKFLVATQADGHYLNNVDSISFHFRKERKVERLLGILSATGYSYRKYAKNGNYKIIVDGVRGFCEEYLIDKSFSPKLFNMSEHERDVFLSELAYWDGHISEKTKYYYSADDMSIESVQIISMLHGMNTHYIGSRHKQIVLPKNNKYMFDRKTPVTSRETEVSCISVPTGYIIIRQYGRVQIIGNCSNWYGNCRTIGIEVCNSTLAPDYWVSEDSFDTLVKLVADIAKRNGFGRLEFLPDGDGTGITGHKDWLGASTSCPGKLYPRLKELCDRANAINYPPTPAPTPTPEPVKPVWKMCDNPREMRASYGAKLVNVITGKTVKTYSTGEIINIYDKADYNGKVYVRTKYSHDKSIDNGFLLSELEEIPIPTPDPDPIVKPEDIPPAPSPVPEPEKKEETDDTPNWFIKFIQKLGEFFISLFKKGE